jgi:hypothetical protein
VQVDPEAQVVGPDQPWPPHWPYFCAEPVEPVEPPAGADVVDVDMVVGGEPPEPEEVVVGPEPAEVVVPEPVPEEPPGPETSVVMGDDSMYTPLKYQSSAPESPLEAMGRRSTPRCQSAPFWAR